MNIIYNEICKIFSMTNSFSMTQHFYEGCPKINAIPICRHFCSKVAKFNPVIQILAGLKSK